MAVTYLAQGNEITAREARNFSIVVAGADATGDQDLVLAFPDDQEFRRWADTTEQAEHVARVLETLENEVLPQRFDEQWIEQMQRLALARGREGFEAFAGLLDLDPRDDEVIRLAMIDRTPLTPSVFDPVLLYDRLIERLPPTSSPVDPRTAWFPIPSGFWPDLSWCGWDNRARSVRVFGMTVLFKNLWFTGRSAWLFGFNGLFNLDTLYADRTTSSIISV